MNKEAKMFFAEEIRAVLSVPEIRSDFDKQLEERLMKKMRAIRPVGTYRPRRGMRKWAFSIRSSRCF